MPIRCREHFQHRFQAPARGCEVRNNETYHPPRVVYTLRKSCTPLYSHQILLIPFTTLPCPSHFSYTLLPPSPPSSRKHSPPLQSPTHVTPHLASESDHTPQPPPYGLTTPANPIDTLTREHHPTATHHRCTFVFVSLAPSQQNSRPLPPPRPLYLAILSLRLPFKVLTLYTILLSC